MTTIEKSIVINAPLDEVDALLIDTERLPEWYPGVVAVDPSPGYPIDVNSSCRITYKTGGITMETKFTTLECTLKSHLIFQMDGMITGTNKWSISGEEGGTKVSVAIDYELAGGSLGKIADKLIVERMNEKYAATALENLKSIMESG